MKKLIFAMVLSLGLIQVASACGDGPLTGDFTTGDIRVRISAIDRCGSTFRYEAWNAPKRLGFKTVFCRRLRHNGRVYS